MDGVVADFRAAYREVELRLFASSTAEPEAAGMPERRAARPDRLAGQEGETDKGLATPEDPAAVEEAEAAAESEGGEAQESPRRSRRKKDAIWRQIKDTPDFWFTLKPTEEGVVRRIHEMMLRHRWEVFFITQRPATACDTVQRQTQKWLVEQGFDLPSVLVLGGSRGAAAGALRLDYHIDDSPQNCLDVIADSKARPLLIVPDDDEVTVASARKLRIGVARTIGQALDILEEASTVRSQPTLFERLATLVGWR
jgi:hypothetical protein